MNRMPLTRRVTFSRRLEKGGRVLIPKTIRWEFKMEPGQVLKVGISIPKKFRGWQIFYAKMEKSGKIFIPTLMRSPWTAEKISLPGWIVDVMLEPI